MQLNVGPSQATRPMPLPEAKAREGIEPKREDEDNANVIQPSSDSKQGASGSSQNPIRGGPRIPAFGDWNKNPEQDMGYTDVFNQVLCEKKTPTNTRPYPPRRFKQTKAYLSPITKLLSQVPKFGSTRADESKLPNLNTKEEVMTIPYKPEMNRDPGPFQATEPTPSLVANKESERADVSHQNQGGHSIDSADSYAVAIKSAGGVPIEQYHLHPMLGGRASDNPSSFDRSNASPAPDWAQTGAGNTGYKAMDKLKERLCDVVFRKKNFGVLQTKQQVLTEEVAQVQSLLISGENDSKDEVQHWLAEADEVLKKTNGIREGWNNTAGKKRLCGTCWDPTFSWETGEMLRDIDKILEQRKGLDLSSFFCGLSSYCKKLESRENKLQDILEALLDIHINMIGIYGMIGVGKTVLAKELVSRAQNEQLFDVVVMVQVSESLDVKLIQTQIAKKLGLQLSDDADEETRAHFLYSVLDEKIMESGQENDTEPVQDSKILVILDGIQCVIELGKVGIPYGQKGRASCKVVLISRNADVCKKMGAEKQILVECLNLEEAKILFQERLGDKIESMEITLEKYQSMENVFLIKCRGLPLLIDTLACTLRSMSWSNWENTVGQMERHTLVEVDELKEVPHAILELCNNFIQNGEKQKLLLLCCLIQQGMDKSVARLMRYGIGLSLFDDDSLVSVMDQINSWVDELKSLSLLVESKEPQHVMVHDIVQDVAISSSSQGMQNLKILDISGITFMDFPSSIGDLKNLITLHLEYCDIKCGFISTISNLTKLKVLSLRESSVETLSEEIGNLTNLRVLDLTRCKNLRTFCIDAVAKLDRLRGLYLYDICWEWSPDDIKKLKSLPLEVLEIIIRNCQVSISIPYLRRFVILCIGDFFDIPQNDFSSFSRVLLVNGDVSLQLQGNGIRDLLLWTEFLQIDRVSGLYNGVGDLNILGFLHLKHLHLSNSEVKCILDTRNVSMIQRDIFPELEILTLTSLYGLTSICHWLPRHSFFPKLRELRLRGLDLLYPYVLPIQLAVKLEFLEVSNCGSLLYIFTTSEINETPGADSSVELSCMKTLELKGLKSLLALQDSLEASITRDELGIPHYLLFNEKIKLPSLKEMHLEGLDHIGCLWDFSGSKECAAELLQTQTRVKEPYGRSHCFANLKYMTVSNCNKLESLLTSRIVNSLLQLEKLEVESCDNMLEVITCDIQDDVNPTTMITFLKLKTLRLKSLDILQCFYRGRLLLKFPMLGELDLVDLRKMKTFTLQTTQSVQTQGTVLFDEEINFPSLEDLRVCSMDIELINGQGDTTKFPTLSRLILNGLQNLKSLPNINSKTLRFLDLEKTECFKVLFSIHPTYMSSMTMSGELEELRMSKLDSLEELFDDEIDDHNQDVSLLYSLRKLELCDMYRLKRIPWNMLTNLRSLIIFNLEGWTSLISTTLLVRGSVLPQLESIEIRYCQSVEAIISQEVQEDLGFVKYGITLLPCLRHISLKLLPRLESFSKGSYEAHFPSLETLEIDRCPVLKSFSLGPLRTPRLKSVILDFKTTKADTFDDLNAVMRGLRVTKVHLFTPKVVQAASASDFRAIVRRLTGVGTEEWGASNAKRLEAEEEAAPDAVL